MHYLPDKKLRHFHVPGYGPDWLDGIVVNHGLDLTLKFGCSFLIRTSRGRIPSCRTFVITIGLIQFFFESSSRSLEWQQKIWILCIRGFGMNAHQYSVLCPNFWISELCYGDTFLTYSTQLTLVCCTVDQTRNKQSAYTKLFKMVTIYSLLEFVNLAVKNLLEYD